MSIRTDKVASVIKKALAREISGIANGNSAGLVTITSVRMSKDLQIANVYLSVYGGKITPGRFIDIIENDYKGKLRTHVGSQVQLRHTPELRFFIDDTLDQMDRIQNLLDSVKKGHLKSDNSTE